MHVLLALGGFEKAHTEPVTTPSCLEEVIVTPFRREGTDALVLWCPGDTMRCDCSAWLDRGGFARMLLGGCMVRVGDVVDCLDTAFDAGLWGPDWLKTAIW